MWATLREKITAALAPMVTRHVSQIVSGLLLGTGYFIGQDDAVRGAVTVPVIASGGAGKVEDFAPAVAAGADAVLAASVFHFRELTIAQVKAAMAADGIVVR